MSFGPEIDRRPALRFLGCVLPQSSWRIAMNRRTVFAGISLLISLALTTVALAQTSPSPQASPAADAAREPIFDGLGNLHHPVTTNSPLAQRFFDQGLTFVYAFNHDEAAGSFKEAARLDPNLAVAAWGIALSLGPNLERPG